MGYSFAAGTTDGPGAFSFKQGTTTTNPLWNALTDLLAVPTPELIACHAPKPILLATGEVRYLELLWNNKASRCFYNHVPSISDELSLSMAASRRFHTAGTNRPDQDRLCSRGVHYYVWKEAEERPGRFNVSFTGTSHRSWSLQHLF